MGATSSACSFGGLAHAGQPNRAGGMGHLGGLNQVNQLQLGHASHAAQMGQMGMGPTGQQMEMGQMRGQPQAAMAQSALTPAQPDDDARLYDALSLEISRALLPSFLDDAHDGSQMSGGDMGDEGGSGGSGGGWASIVKKAPPKQPPKPAAATASQEAAVRPLVLSAQGKVDQQAMLDEHGERIGFKVFNVNGDSVVRLYQTNIVTIRSNGDVCLSSGGWRTYQTFKGLNAALRSLAPALSVVAHGPIYENRWRVVSQAPGSAAVSIPFHDGMTVPAAAAASLVTRKQVREAPVDQQPNPSGAVPVDYVCKICKVPGHWIQNCPKAPDTPKPPPAGYICKICKVPGHWIQNCPNTTSEVAAAAAVKEAKSARTPAPSSATQPGPDALVETLHELSGESLERCRKALQVSNGDVNAAAELLLSGTDPSEVGRAPSSDDGWTRR